MSRTVLLLVIGLLAIAAGEFAALTGAFSRIGVGGPAATRAYAGVPQPDTATGTPSLTPTPTDTATPAPGTAIATATSTPISPPAPTSTPVSPPASPPPHGNGSISGIVTNALGTPVAGALVDAELFNCCGASSSATTTIDGTYTLVGLPTGSYRVVVIAGGYVTQFFDHSDSYYGATAVAVVDGAETPSVDFALDAGATISGTVVDKADVPIGGAYVQLFGGVCCTGPAYTASDGTYTLRDLPPGDFTISAAGGGYLEQYYDHVSSQADATKLHITAGSATTNINFTLSKGGSITGVVRDGADQPIAGAFVQASGSAGVGSTSSGADGSYTISGLDAGEYIVSAYANGYVRQFWDNVDKGQLASPVAVALEATTGGINFQLSHGAHITGTVVDAGAQPIAGVIVYANGSGCCPFGAASATTDANGSYDVTGLSEDDYVVSAQKPGYATQYYDGVYNYQAATSVHAGGTNTTSGINFTLLAGATISGTVRDEANGAPLAGAFVSAQGSPCCTTNGYAWTDASGAYHIDDLPPGNNTVSAGAPNYAVEFYNNRTQFADADPVVTTAGANTAGIDFSLHFINPDHLIDATGISPRQTSSASTSGFGLDATEQQPCGGIGATIWYTTTAGSSPPIAGTWTFDTNGSNFDTVVALYSGPVGATSPSQLTPIDCADDSPGPQASLTFLPAEGTTYYFQVGGHNGATGSLDVALNCTGDYDCDGVPDSTDNCPVDWNADQANTDSAPIITPGVLHRDTSIPNGDAFGDACDPDADNDGIPNWQESTFGPLSPPLSPPPITVSSLPASPPAGPGPVNCPQATGPLNPLKADTDGDGVLDGAECALGSDPANAASVPVVGGPDDDGDGLSNAFEISIGSDPHNADTDHDGIPDGIEYKYYGTSPTNPDTDGDGCSDGKEIASVDENPAVNVIDLLIVAQNFLQPGKPDLDINKDGVINVIDLQLIAANFGVC